MTIKLEIKLKKKNNTQNTNLIWHMTIYILPEYYLLYNTSIFFIINLKKNKKKVNKKKKIQVPQFKKKLTLINRIISKITKMDIYNTKYYTLLLSWKR